MVVPHRPGRRLLTFFVIVLSVVGGMVGGHWYGVREGGNAGAELADLRQQLTLVENENARLSQEIAVLERSSDMDRQASSEIQATISELREYIAKLEQDVQFYRQAMTSEFENEGLIVGEMDLQGTADPQRVRYKLVMRQEESDGEYLLGHVNVDVVGQLQGQKAVHPLRDLSADEDQLDIRLRFRYFQNIEGILELPPGFEPQQVVINAVATAPMARTINRTFDWVVEGE